MIVKEYENCIILEKLISLDRRLPLNHPMKVQVSNDLVRKKTERKGELAVQYPLSFLDEELINLFYSVRIIDAQGAFQIDILLLTEKFILVLEVKNWYGEMVFAENNQVVRVGDHGKEEGFNNPITQLELQKFRLQRWLSKKGFNNIPIFGFVVISFSSTLVKSVNTDYPIPKEIVYSQRLKIEIEKLLKTNTKIVLTKSQINRLNNQILKAHSPKDQDILLKYEINPKEIIRGVICENCIGAPMKRIINKWICEQCKVTSENAHLAAFNDYRLLFNPQVKNRDLRQFLQIKSPDVTKKLIDEERYFHIGNNSARVYYLNKK